MNSQDFTGPERRARARPPVQFSLDSPHHFDPLTLSAILVAPHAFWALCLFVTSVFHHPSYAILSGFAPQWVWGVLNAVIAAGRLYVALRAHWGLPISRLIDRATIYASVAWWFGVTCQFVVVGAGKTAAVNTGTFAAMAFIVAMNPIWSAPTCRNK